MVETNRCDHNDATRNGCFDCMRARIKTLENTVGFHKNLSDIRWYGRRDAQRTVADLLEQLKTSEDALAFRRGQVVDLEDELIDTRSDVVGADETIAEQTRHIEMLEGKVVDYARQLENLAYNWPGSERRIKELKQENLELRGQKEGAEGAMVYAEAEIERLRALVETLRQTVREYQHDNADLLVRLQTAREAALKDRHIIEVLTNDRG
jgi:chromosome segregation ATPase